MNFARCVAVCCRQTLCCSVLQYVAGNTDLDVGAQKSRTELSRLIGESVSQRFVILN